jgi:hypothetical protein
MQTSKVMQEREKIKKKIQTELIKLLQPQVKVQPAPTATASASSIRSAAPAPIPIKPATATAPLRSVATAPIPIQSAPIQPTPIQPAPLRSAATATAPLRSAAPEPYSKEQEELYSLGKDAGFKKDDVDRILNEAGNDTKKATNLLLEYLQFGLPESKPPSKLFQPTKSGLSADADKDELYAYATSLGYNQQDIENLLENLSGDVKKVMEFLSPEHASTSFSLDPAPPQQITSVPLANEGGNFCYMNVAFQLMMSMSLFKTVIKDIDIQSILRGTRFTDVLEKLKFMSSYNILNMMVRQFESANFETLRYPDPKYYLVLSLLPTFVIYPSNKNMLGFIFGRNLQITQESSRHYSITFFLKNSDSYYNDNLQSLQELSIGDDIYISIDKGKLDKNIQWTLTKNPLIEQKQGSNMVVVTCTVDFVTSSVQIENGNNLRVSLHFNYIGVDYIGKGQARKNLIQIFNDLSQDEQSKVFHGEELVPTVTDSPGKRKFLEVMDFLKKLCSLSSGQQDASELYNSVVEVFCFVLPSLTKKISSSCYYLDSCSLDIKDIGAVTSEIKTQIPRQISSLFTGSSMVVNYGKFGKTEREIKEIYSNIQHLLDSSITEKQALEGIKLYDTYLSLVNFSQSKSIRDKIDTFFGSQVPYIIREKGNKILSIRKEDVAGFIIQLIITGGCSSIYNCFIGKDSLLEKSDLYTPLCDGQVLQNVFYEIGEQDNIVFGLGRAIGGGFDRTPIALDPTLRLKKGDGGDIIFRLQSVICKSGSMAGGHYILVYFYYNSDGSVTKIVYNDAQAPHIANESFKFDDKAIDEVLKRQSTIVMYERI